MAKKGFKCVMLCLVCEKPFHAYPYECKQGRKFCSTKCARFSERGRRAWNAGTKGIMEPNKSSFKKGHKAWNKNKTNPHSKGSKNCNWKGGKIFARGYIYILDPSHPNATAAGYVKRSRLNAEAILGRFLVKEEQIHHIDEDKLNDHHSNLYLFDSNSAHILYHNNVRWGNRKPITISNLSNKGCKP